MSAAAPPPDPTVDPPDPTVVVAVLTYRRPAELAALLPELVAQAATLVPPAHVVVVDNDPDAPAVHAADPHGSPRATVAAAGGHAAVMVHYAWQPRPGIAAARNEALDAAFAADVGALVFIDDDERPAPGWLDALVATWTATGAGAVVGPVVSAFEAEMDPWVAAGGFFERRSPPTGTRVEVAATNNLLLDLAVVSRAGLTFDERFGLSGGSDTLFTRQLHACGAEMVWCAQALVTDRVPASRTTRRWVLARALRSGNGWSRTSLALVRWRPASAVPVGVRDVGVRGGLVARGGVRALGGGARLVVGTALRAAGRGSGQQARGARTLARGAGMVGGALGWTYVEYRRRS